jgi:histone H2B
MTKSAINKRHKKRNFESFSLYVYKVLRSISTDVGISKKGMSVINSLISDMFEQVAFESSKLVRYNKKKTLNSNDIQTAVQLLLPPDLGGHAKLEATKALTKFNESK